MLGTICLVAMPHCTSQRKTPTHWRTAVESNGWKAVRTLKASKSKQAVNGFIATIRVTNEAEGIDETLGGRRCARATAVVVGKHPSRSTGAIYGTRSSYQTAEVEASRLRAPSKWCPTGYDYAHAIIIEDADA